MILDEILSEVKSEKGYGTEFSTAEEFYNSDDDDFSFGENSYHGGLNIQTIFYRDEPVGTLYERERNFLVPILVHAETWDLEYVDNNKEGDSEWRYNGLWLQMKRFPTLKEFEGYVRSNFDKLTEINKNVK